MGQITHKINLLAEDKHFYLSNPSESLAKLHVVLQSLGLISGYIVNC